MDNKDLVFILNQKKRLFDKEISQRIKDNEHDNSTKNLLNLEQSIMHHYLDRLISDINKSDYIIL